MITGILSHWNEHLDALPKERTDLYFREEYHRIYSFEGQNPLCVYAKDERGEMLLPYLHRSFTFEGKEYHELETAYGYGGPVCTTDDPAFWEEAALAIRDLLTREGYLAGFVRFHPLLDNFHGLEKAGQIIQGQHTVAIDLRGTEDEIWSQELHAKNRSAIKRSIRDSLTFEADESFRHLPDFIRLYNSTMERIGANPFYFFPESYYRALIEQIPDSFLGLVRMGDEVVASAIFMYSGPYGHYHLAGSNPAFLAHSPNNLLIWKAAMELKARGVETLHLGGGNTADPSDTLFLFKHRFSQSVRTFHIGKFVFDRPAYERICADWEKANPEKIAKYGKFLLKYKY